MAFADSKHEAGFYGKIYSAYDAVRMPQSYGKLVQKYGNGFKLLNFLHLAGQTMDVTTETIKIFEEGVPERPVTVSIPLATTAPISPVVTFATSDNSDDYAREGFDLVIPSTYTNSAVPEPARLYKDGADWKIKPYNEALTITTAIVTKELILGASSWGYGTGQPGGMRKSYYERSTNARILKDTAGIEGGQIFQKDWAEIEMENGKQGIWSDMIAEMDFRLDSQKDLALFLSRVNDNDALTATSSITGGTSKIPSFDGLIPTMKEFSQELTYSTNFDMTKFDAVKTLLESVGVTNQEVDFLVGTGLMTNIENAMLTWSDSHSQSELYSLIQKYIGFNVKTIEKNGCKFNLTQLDSLSNPNKLGASEYPYKNWGFMFPKGTHAVGFNEVGQQLRLPHLTVGYAVGKSENRRHWFNVHPGVNGIGQNVVANDIDGVKLYVGTHMIPIWTMMNQTILVTKA